MNNIYNFFLNILFIVLFFSFFINTKVSSHPPIYFLLPVQTNGQVLCDFALLENFIPSFFLSQFLYFNFVENLISVTLELPKKDLADRLALI